MVWKKKKEKGKRKEKEEEEDEDKEEEEAGTAAAEAIQGTCPYEGTMFKQLPTPVSEGI